MLWRKFTVRTSTADCDMVCATLMDFGITDVQIENNVQLTDEELNQMYADFVKELPEDNGECAVVFYLDENGFIPQGLGTGDSPGTANEMQDFDGTFVDMEEVRNALSEAAELFGIEPVTIEESTVDPKDWNERWKEYFKPFSVGSIVIKPTWEEIPEELMNEAEKSGHRPAVIDIDPGMAFGTGRHEITRLCLQELQRCIKPGDRVIDLGCGSGILGIAALKLGASFVTAVDIDPEAVKIAKENFDLNIEESRRDTYRVFTANVLKDEEIIRQLSQEKYDLVIANILAEVIIPLSQKTPALMKDDGLFISSGIIDIKQDEVVKAIEDNPMLDLAGVREDGEWRCVTAALSKGSE